MYFINFCCNYLVPDLVFVSSLHGFGCVPLLYTPTKAEHTLWHWLFLMRRKCVQITNTENYVKMLTLTSEALWIHETRMLCKIFNRGPLGPREGKKVLAEALVQSNNDDKYVSILKVRVRFCLYRTDMRRGNM